MDNCCHKVNNPPFPPSKKKPKPYSTDNIIFKNAPKCCLETNFQEILPIPQCQRGAKTQLCDRLRHFKDLSVLLQNVLDVTETIIQIMEYCGIHKCVTIKATDIIIYSFLHFDENDDNPCGHNKKKLRKEEFICDLRRHTRMTKEQANLTYKITKSAFQAFYYRQISNSFDEMWFDECAWRTAARKTIQSFEEQDCVEDYEIDQFRDKINKAYKNYLDRRRKKTNQPIYKFSCCCWSDSKTDVKKNKGSKPECCRCQED